ncbi:MAG: DUF3859 domain-containing protein [Pseudanabaenaceae cyanobacterium]
MSTPNHTPNRLDTLDTKELDEVIAEIQRISRKREGTLTIDQAREILRELNLPEELLEEAVLQLKRRQAAKEHFQLNLVVSIGALLLVAIGIGGNLWLQRQQEQAIAQVAAKASAIRLVTNPNQPVAAVSRPNEVWYRVTLVNAPIGQRLEMGCDWQNPQGEVVHQNRYQTQEITKSVWDTRCKYQIEAGVPTGTWQVTMNVTGRTIAKTPFSVK